MTSESMDERGDVCSRNLGMRSDVEEEEEEGECFL